MRRTKIVATIGPATEAPETLRALLAAGVDVVRVNLSHGDAATHRRHVETVRRVAHELGRTVGVMFDTRGPEVRLGPVAGGAVELRPGQTFRLYTHAQPGDATGAAVNHPGLARDVRPGDSCLIDDGRIVGRVLAVDEGDVTLAIEVGGLLQGGKKVAFPTASLSLPALSEEDRADLALAQALDVDIVAASFIRTPENVLEIREVLDTLGLAALLVAKIETREGVENLEAILRVADGLMVARGDLGVAFPPEEVPIIQKRIVNAANRMGKPVVTATQMLESMVHAPQPTRAEASDVANAIWDGTDAVMLSAETATGDYPVAAVEVMARIALRADAALTPRRGPAHPRATVTEAISLATCEIAEGLDVAAIVTATSSGHTARMVARHRPRIPIVAATPRETVARQLTLLWGTVPFLIRPVASSDQMVEEALRAAVESGLAREGDTVVVTFGVPVGVSGTTNLLQVHTIGGIAVRGHGLGGQVVTGPVRRIERLPDLRRTAPGDILVLRAADPAMAPYFERAAAVVAEEGGLTSPTAILGVSVGIPVIVGAEGALGVLREGETVTVDARRGIVYRGTPRL